MTCSKQCQMEEAVWPEEKDVLLGRGGLINKQHKNSLYHSKIMRDKNKYKESSMKDKRVLANNIMRELWEEGSRFLEKADGHSNRWIVVKEKRKIENKIMQALRDKESRPYTPSSQTRKRSSSSNKMMISSSPAEKDMEGTDVASVHGNLGIQAAPSMMETASIALAQEEIFMTQDIANFSQSQSFDFYPIPENVSVVTGPSRDGSPAETSHIGHDEHQPMLFPSDTMTDSVQELVKNMSQRIASLENRIGSLEHTNGTLTYENFLLMEAVSSAGKQGQGEPCNGNILEQLFKWDEHDTPIDTAAV